MTGTGAVLGTAGTSRRDMHCRKLLLIVLDNNLLNRMCMSGYLAGFETGLASTEHTHSYRLQAEQSLLSMVYTIVVLWTPETSQHSMTCMRSAP